MKLIKNFTLLILLAFVVTGCISTNTNRLSSSLSAPQVKAPALDANVTVDANRKITGTSDTTILFGFWRFKGSNKFVQNVNYSSGTLSKFNPIKGFSAKDKAKAAAVYNAVTRHNVDVIVAPRYEINEENYFFVTKYKVKVVGYKGTITSFTKAKDRAPSVNASFSIK
jgi:hypothetical protein